MARENLNDLAAFVAVARERSFTRAAAQLGVTHPAVSHSLRVLEERMGVRLLARTSRSVVPTDAGARLLATVGAHVDGIKEGLAGMGEFRDKPAGHFRIASTEHAAETILWPVVEQIANSHSKITFEIVIDVGLSNIVSEGYDAGVRVGEAIEKDMVATRIGPDLEMAVVGTPAYLEARGVPQSLQDLVSHNCINRRLASAGALYPWKFKKDGREINVRVDGQFTFSTSGLIRKAALASLGLASIPMDEVEKDLASGSLVRVLSQWCPPLSGYHLHYPSRRQSSLAFRLLVDALRFRG